MSDDLPINKNEVDGGTKNVEIDKSSKYSSDDENDIFIDCIERVSIDDEDPYIDKTMRTSPTKEFETDKNTKSIKQDEMELLSRREEQYTNESVDSLGNCHENVLEEINTQPQLGDNFLKLANNSVSAFENQMYPRNNESTLEQSGTHTYHTGDKDDVKIKSETERDYKLLSLRGQLDNSLMKDRSCDPCRDSGTFQKATYSCHICNEFICDQCALLHQSRKLTKVHILTQLDGTKLPCDWCTYLGATNSPAMHYCDKCEESLCVECFSKHQSQRKTKDHLVKQPEFEGNPGSIEPATIEVACSSCASNRPAEVICKACECVLCNDCLARHVDSGTTSQHTIESLNVEIKNAQKMLCEPCKYKQRKTGSSVYCIDCKERLCQICEKQHSLHMPNHRVTTNSSFKYCAICMTGGLQRISRHICIDCENQLPLCEDCSSTHVLLKPFRGHRLKPLQIEDFPPQRRTVADISVKHEDIHLVSSGNKENTERPGKPKRVVSDKRSIDSITLTWDLPGLFYDTFYYQLRYKEAGSSEWKFFDSQLLGNNNVATICKLKSNTKYTFQVRMVNIEKEGPYSEQSEETKTLKSAATRMLDLTAVIEEANSPITLRKVPFSHIPSGRNEKNRTRKLAIGHNCSHDTVEKTIMLVGATGSGKSTLVDGMMNYVAGVNWDDNFRLIATDLEEGEKQGDKTQAVSQTKWITCYSIKPMKGSRIPYTVNVVDTPGFGDTAGIERDQEIVEQIRQLFHDESSKGIAFVDAVCFLVKAPDARLTHSQRYIFESILSLFGNDIKENICLIVTFADGNTPPVLEALRECDLPCDPFFPFNNSGLFVSNSSKDETLAPMFWEMGGKSFAVLFDYIEKMNTQSLLLTKTVLDKRNKIQLTVENMMPLIDNAIHMVDELRNEIIVFRRHEKEIEENADFVYTVSETKQEKKDLPKGQHITNCLICNTTCHRKCKIAEDEHKRKCKAMDRETGNCTQCLCHWTEHKNTPYIFEYITRHVEKTYTEKLQMYNIASSNKEARKEVISNMEAELTDLECQLQEDILIVNECTNKQKEIALRPNPLSMDQYIELLINVEKSEKKEGFIKRIEVLSKLKKKSNIHNTLSQFKEQYARTKKDAYQLTTQKKKTSKFQKMKSFVLQPWK